MPSSLAECGSSSAGGDSIWDRASNYIATTLYDTTMRNLELKSTGAVRPETSGVDCSKFSIAMNTAHIYVAFIQATLLITAPICLYSVGRGLLQRLAQGQTGRGGQPGRGGGQQPAERKQRVTWESTVPSLEPKTSEDSVISSEPDFTLRQKSLAVSFGSAQTWPSPSGKQDARLLYPLPDSPRRRVRMVTIQ